MDLQGHIAVLWRHRLTMAVGLFVAALLAVLAGYHVQPGKSPMLTPRGHEEWMSVSRVLVTQAGFPEGRVTLSAGDPGLTATTPKPGGLEFADPGRFQSLASLYAVLTRSDQVLSRVTPRPSPEKVTAVAVDPDGAGNQAALPVLEISTTAQDATAARKLNSNVVGALRQTLAEQQNDNGIAATARVRLDSLDDPSAPALIGGRSHIASVAIFLIVLMATIFLAKLLERARVARATARRPETEKPERNPPRPPTAPEIYADQPLGEWHRPERPAGAPSDEIAAGARLPQP